MKTIILFCGLFNLGFAIFHIYFWVLLKWRVELQKLNFINNAVMQIINIQLIYYFIFTAILCLIVPDDMLSTRIGKLFLIGSSIFWLIRTVQQFYFFKFNNFRLNILTILFIIGTILFAIPIIY